MLRLYPTVTVVVKADEGQESLNIGGGTIGDLSNVDQKLLSNPSDGHKPFTICGNTRMDLFLLIRPFLPDFGDSEHQNKKLFFHVLYLK